VTEQSVDLLVLHVQPRTTLAAAGALPEVLGDSTLCGRLELAVRESLDQLVVRVHRLSSRSSF
jgi:hypothetical protein